MMNLLIMIDVATSSMDSVIRVWDVEKGKSIVVIEAPPRRYIIFKSFVSPIISLSLRHFEIFS